jgi:hypothetical protein
LKQYLFDWSKIQHSFEEYLVPLYIRRGVNLFIYLFFYLRETEGDRKERERERERERQHTRDS